MRLEENMRLTSLLHRTSTLSKIVKFNVFVLIALVVAATMVVSFASTNASAPSETALPTPACSARVAIVLDRSSSISIPEFGGSTSNVNTIKTAANDLIEAIKGPDSYSDVYAFATTAQRMNTVSSWWKLDGLFDGVHTNVDIQKLVIGQTPFKIGARVADSGDVYKDGIVGSHEGATNWQDALEMVQNSNYTNHRELPTHLVIFTDGNPTTNNEDVFKALHNGAADASGNHDFPSDIVNRQGTTESADLDPAITAAESLRTAGVKIIPISVGSNVNKQNLQYLAGSTKVGSTNVDNPVYQATDYSQLEQKFRDVAKTICGTASGVYVRVRETIDGHPGNKTYVSARVKVGTTGTLSGPPEAGEEKLTVESAVDNSATWTQYPVKASSPWNATASLVEPPAGYVANGYDCRPNYFDPQFPPLAHSTPGDPNLTHATITAVAPGTRVMCEFWVKKATTTTTTTSTTSPATTSTSSTTTTTTTPTPPGVKSWTATKKAEPSIAVPGESVKFTITVKNTSSTETLNNFDVTDEKIGFPTNSTDGHVDTLAPGASKDIVVNFVIPKTYSANTFNNVAKVCLAATAQTQGQPGNTNEECKSPEANVKIARIQITKSASSDISYPGSKVTYTFVVKNTGGVDIDPGVVTDSVLGAIGDPGAIKAGESATLTKEFTVPEDAKADSKIVNTATVCAPVPEHMTPVDIRNTDCKTTCPTNAALVCDQDSHTLTIKIPTIKIDKGADKDSANVGDTVKYTFTVTNTSTIDMTKITVIDNVLGDLGTIDNLKAGESVEKTVSYVVPANGATQGTIRNVATACFTTPAVTANCASDDHTLTVTQVLGTSVTRSSSGSLPFTGAQTLWLAGVALLIMVSGSILILITRKRKGLA